MKRYVFFLLLLFPSAESLGGFEQLETGARVRSLGGAAIGLANEAWAIAYNPSGIAQLSAAEVSLFYSPNPFGISELRQMSVAGALPTELGSFGLFARQFGFDLYKEFNLAVCYSTEVSNVFVGLAVNYHSVSIARYGSAGTVGIDVGLLIPILENVRWGLAARNVNAPKIGSSGERLPQLFTGGLLYEPVRRLGITFDVQKEIDFPLAAKLGVEYWIVDEMALRIGAADQPAAYAGGIGIRYAFFQVDYAFHTHQDLGISHHASITLRWQ